MIKNSENEVEELEKNIEYKKAKKEQKQENKKTSKKIIPIITLSMLIIATIVLFITNKINVINYIFLIFAMFNFIYLIILKIRSAKLNKKTEEEEIKYKKELEILEENLKSKKVDIDNRKSYLNKKIFENEKELKNKYIGIYLDDEFLKNLSEIKIELEKQEKKNNELKVDLKGLQIERKNSISKLEQLPEIEEEIKNLKEQKEELNSLAISIQVARDGLEEAYTEMKKSLVPKFTEKLSQTVDKVSGGKYKNVKFSDEEGLLVELESGEYKKAERLSTGTIFQMYLSLRLSIADSITEEKLPIILDEAFAYYDDERLENMLQYLSKEYADRQIIIFTCSKREKEILEKNGIQYNYIEIM